MEQRQQRTFQPFADFRAAAADNGGFTAYGNVKGYLDSHGTIMWHGCYSKCLAALKENGFVPDTHGVASNYVPTHKELIGFFTNAVEDEYGLLVEAEFHSTHFAQDVRTQLLERTEAGKTCGMSIGFFIRESFQILPQDYATEIPKYSLPEFVQQNLERANQFWCVEILTEVEVFEVSLTVVPSNEASLVAEVRTSNKGKRSRTTVTPNGSLHYRTNDFLQFEKTACDVLNRYAELERQDREALAVTLRSAIPTLQEIIHMAETRAKGELSRDHRDAVEECRDALEKLTRTHRDMEEHHSRIAKMHDDAEDLHREARKASRTLAKALDKLGKGPDDGDEEEPKDKKEDKRMSFESIAHRYRS